MSKLSFQSIINEQTGLNSYFYGSTPGGDKISGLSDAGQKEILKKYSDPHTLIGLTMLAAGFTGPAAPYLESFLATIDAEMYYEEGDKTMAAISGIFAAIPFIGPLIGEIPGVKELGKKGMALIAEKITKNISLSAYEAKIAKNVIAKQNQIKLVLTNATKKLAPIAKNVQSYKVNYIKRFGQTAYDDIIRKFISGSIDKEELFNTLKKATVPRIGSFITKFGVKFSTTEVSLINDFIKNIKNLPKYGKTHITVQTIDGSKDILVQLIDKEVLRNWSTKDQMWASYMQSGGFADNINNSIYLVMDNISQNTKDLANLCYHEFAHIKDPSIVKTITPKNYFKGVQDLTKALDLRKQGLSNSKEFEQLYASGEQNYLLSAMEITAENTRILQGMSDNVNELKNTLSTKEMIKGLDELINYAKNPTTNPFTKKASKILGYSDGIVHEYFQILVKKPSEYRNLWTKIAQQADYLKTQVNLAAPTTKKFFNLK